MLLPPFLWNYGNDWITFRHTAHHIELDTGNIIRPNLFFEYLGAQAGVITPILFVAMYYVLGQIVKKRLLFQNFNVFYLGLFSYPMLLGFHVLSIFSRVHPNWPAAFYLCAFPLVIAWAFGSINHGDGDYPRGRKILKVGILVGAVLTFFTYFPQTLASVGFPLTSKTDPTIRLRGWSKLGLEVGALMNSVATKYGRHESDVFFMSDKRQIVSELAFYIPGQPEVLIWPRKPKINSQYNLWGGLERKLGWNALFVTAAGEHLPMELESCCESVKLEKELNIFIREGIVKSYDVYSCKNLQRLPAFYLSFPKAE